MEAKLKGKVIVISGGTKGVGKAAAEEFARQGAKVVIGGRDEASAMNAISVIEAYGSEGLFVHTDVRRVEDCKRLFDVAYEKFGRIDGFFNYAGVTYVSPLDTCDQETFDSIMEINFRACFFCCQMAIKYMRMNENGGSIVFTGSPHAWCGEKDRTAYACSKGVLFTLMEHIAHHYAADKIRCNYLTLGWTMTEGEIALRKSQGMDEAQLREYAASFIPMGRIAEKTDYLDALVFLMSDGSQMATGANLRMTGGFYC